MARIEEKNKRISDIPFFILEEYFSTTAAYYDNSFPFASPESQYSDEQRAIDYLFYLPDANEFSTVSLVAPSGTASAGIIKDYSSKETSGHNLDTSFKLNRYNEFWQTSGADVEWQADVYIKKGTKIYDWIIENYPSFVQSDQELLYFGKVIDHSDSFVEIKYIGHRDTKRAALPRYNRTERFLVFLNTFFDRVESLVSQKRKGLEFLRDIEEINFDEINKIGSMLIDELFDNNSEFYIPEAAKRIFLRELVNILKKKGTYRPLYFLWDILSWFRYNTIQIRELYHSEPIESLFREYDKKNMDISGAIVRGNAALDTMAGYDEVLILDGVEMKEKAGYIDIPKLIMDSEAAVGVSAVDPVSVLDSSWILDARLPGMIATDTMMKIPFYMVNISLDESTMWGLPPAAENICYNPYFSTSASGAPGICAVGWLGNNYQLEPSPNPPQAICGSNIIHITNSGTIVGNKIDVATITNKYKDFYPELVIDSYLPNGMIFDVSLSVTSAGCSGTAVLSADITFSDNSTQTITGSHFVLSSLSAFQWKSDIITFNFDKRIKFIQPKLSFDISSGSVYCDYVYMKPWYSSGAIINDVIANSIYLAFEKFKPVSHKSYYFLVKNLSADISWEKHNDKYIKEIWSIAQTSGGPLGSSGAGTSGGLPTSSSALSAVSAVKNALYDNTYLPIHWAVFGQQGTKTITGTEKPLSAVPLGQTYYDYSAPSGIKDAESRVLTLAVFEKKYYMSPSGNEQRILIKIKIDSEDEVWFNELWLFNHEYNKLLFYSTFPKIYKPKNVSILFNIVILPT